jgi:hypothetical protein
MRLRLEPRLLVLRRLVPRLLVLTEGVRSNHATRTDKIRRRRAPGAGL